MLDLAVNYVDELQRQFRKTWFKEKYMFWNFANYYEDVEIKESTWNNHQFVSLDSNGNVIGYIGYSIDRANELVDGLNIINFTENNMAVFGVDLGQVLCDIFEKFHFRKLIFSVVIGNPVEKTYDKMIRRYGGEIIGIQRKQVRLIDGQFYDVKMYEIFADNYLKSKKIMKVGIEKVNEDLI